MSQRIKSVDIAKGMGIIFLLIVHSIGIPVFGRLVGAFYMPLFYYLSGYTSSLHFALEHA